MIQCAGSHITLIIKGNIRPLPVNKSMTTQILTSLVFISSLYKILPLERREPQLTKCTHII